MLLGLVVAVPVRDDRGRELSQARQLGGRGGDGDDHGRGKPEPLCCPGHAERMVAAGSRYYAVAAARRGQGGKRAADLERARRLEALELEQDTSTEARARHQRGGGEGGSDGLSRSAEVASPVGHAGGRHLSTSSSTASAWSTSSLSL